MTRRTALVGLITTVAAAWCDFARGQSPSQTTLVIDLQNVVTYLADVSDPSKNATNPNLTPSASPINFGMATQIGDIVAVNGQPAKGTFVGRARGIQASPAPNPGGAVADITRTALREDVFEILMSDGTPVGTIMSFGFAGGPAPPGVPSAERGNFAIVGGTGAFFGAHGTVSGTGGNARSASITEDPANRRRNGGGNFTMIVHLIPMNVPQIVSTPNGPAVAHSDFTPVTTAKPATAGEVLIAMATGLGPTRPGVDYGQPFPTDPLQPINSPVSVNVNQQSTDVINAIGWPGLVDTYRVDFRVPVGITTGQASLQLSSAWISGPTVNVPIQ